MEQVLEAEKLLFAIYEAHKLKIDICKEKINPYVYLMRNRYGVPLYYSFRFTPVPYSEELEDDLISLKTAGHISFSSPITIADKGLERIKERIDQLSSLSKSIDKALEEMSGWDNKLLFQEVYNTATK